MLKVAFIPTYVSGVVFYRVWQPYLAMRKLFKDDEFTVTWYSPNQYTMHPWEWNLYEKDKATAIYYEIDAACRWADVVVWMGLHTPKALDLFIHMRAKHGKPFASEFDDYIYSIPRYNSAWGPYRPGTDITRIAMAQMRASDALIVSTPHLADLYRDIKSPVYVVENTINLSLWPKVQASSLTPSQRVTIGWMGGGTHNEDHEMIQDAVMEVLEKCPKSQFHYISGCPPPKKFEKIKRIRWDHAFKPIHRYPEWISKQKFNIGIAPLLDNEFNRGKSNLRWLEYSALGIPTVASPVVNFKGSIEDGKTGFLAGTHEKWIDLLTNLINEPALRENIGSAARREVKRLWNPEIQAQKYRAALEGIANAEPDAEFVGHARQPAG